MFDFSLPKMDLQIAIEKQYNRKHINGKLKKLIQESAVVQAQIKVGVELIEELLNGEYYQSKMERFAQLRSLNMEQLVTDLFVGTCYFRRPELMASAVTQLSHHVGFSDRLDAIKTVADLLSVLWKTGAFHFTKESRSAPIFITSDIELPDDFMEFVENAGYLPPLLVKPKKIKKNFDSGYYTYNDSVILGDGNHHEYNVCLHTLDTYNSVALKLDLDIIDQVAEIPNKPIIDADELEQWNRFTKRSTEMYELMVNCGNKFYFNHRYDKRGRMYSSGYHIHSQGGAYKKASLELYDEELVEGVP